MTESNKEDSASVEDLLLAAVYASPADDAPRAVYADWLLEQGHPLGQFIQLQLARSAGKKGTKGKEQQLLAEHGKTFWPKHPALVERHVPPWEATERGFPARFNPPLPVSDDERRKTVERWIALAGNPAWATFRRVTLWSDLDPNIVARLLLDAPMPLLEQIDGIGIEVFKRVANSDLPARRMQVDGDPSDFPVVGGLPNLRELELSRAPLDVALKALSASGLRDRLEVFELHPCELQTSFVHVALDVLAELPQNVARVSVVENYGRSTARRSPTGVALEVTLDYFELDDVVEALRTLDRGRVASVHVSFRGYFTKRNRAPSERAIEQASAHLSNVTYSWSSV
jgi:uncharacterized protein (TIGR02996 family)